MSGCGGSNDPAPPARQSGAAVSQDDVKTSIAAVTRADFGALPDGTRVRRYTLTNSRGMQVRAIDYGGIITSIEVPDRDGELADIALGHDSLEGYLDNDPYLGAIIGRYANRIAGAQFTLDGHTYRLAANDGPNTLHGGIRGFDKYVWAAEPFERPGEVGVRFSRTSPDGEEGFPGALETQATYTLTDRNELRFEFFATTDQPTVVNLTQHVYFNLAGEGSGDVLAHELTIHAGRYTPVDATMIPTGELASVAGTPFDFRSSTAIGARIAIDHPQLRLGKGYDHNYVLDRTSEGLVLAARVQEPVSGRYMEVRTSEPGMQFYTGNFLDGSIIGKSGRAYAARSGFCLETQHFPDSPNQPSFPSTTLRPGEEYRSITVYSFGAL